jgi:hypothetical protein
LLAHFTRHRFVISVNPFLMGDDLLDRPFTDGPRIAWMRRLSGEDHVHTDEVRVPTLRPRNSISGWAGIKENHDRFRMKRPVSAAARSQSPVANNCMILVH